MNSTDIRQRVIQIFEFLQALDTLRHPPKRRLRDQEWHRYLDEFPLGDGLSSCLVQHISGPAVDVPEGVILYVERPPVVPPPDLPLELHGLMGRDWAEPDAPPCLPEYAIRVESGAFRRALADEEEHPEYQRVLSDPDLERSYARALAAWEVWAPVERHRREVRKAFDAIHQLHARLDREGEAFDLVYADGVLNWRVAQGGIHHPLLTQKVNLIFEPQGPAFKVEVSDEPAEFYSALLRQTPVTGQTIGDLQTRFQANGIDPLLEGGLDEFLTEAAHLLDKRGTFEGWADLSGERDYPRLGRRPSLFLRRRTQGYARAIESALGVLHDEAHPIPQALRRLAGDEIAPTSEPLCLGESDDAYANEQEGLLLTKPANAAQVQIARSLEQQDSVVVWGPPGTGKTHTIANLIGHCLAEGLSVLVTSHTEKALAVVRDKIEEDLRPLCVSLVGQEEHARQQLEASVEAINQRTSVDMGTSAQRLIAQYEQQRRNLLMKIRSLREDLEAARQDEYRNVSLPDRAIPPRQAAELLQEGLSLHDWIPGPITSIVPLPLTEQELRRILELGKNLSVEDETEGQLELAVLQDLPLPERFRNLVHEREHHRTQASHYQKGLWKASATREIEPLERLLAMAMGLRAELQAISSEWIAQVFEACYTGFAGEWNSLVEHVERLNEEARALRDAELDHRPELQHETHLELADLLQNLEAIREHYRQGGTLNWWTRMRRKAWVQTVERVRINDGPPARLEHYDILVAVGKLHATRHRVSVRWDRQMGDVDGPSWRSLGRQPERKAIDFTDRIRTWKEWSIQQWEPLRQSCEAVGFEIRQLEETLRPNRGAETIPRLLETLGTVETQIQARLALLHITQLDLTRDRLHEAMLGMSKAATCTRQIAEAIQANNPDAYERAFTESRRLTGLRALIKERQNLLDRLKPHAPTWAARLEQRGPDTEVLRGNPQRAWEWRLVQQELSLRSRRDAAQTAKMLATNKEELEKVTTELVRAKAWSSLSQRLTGEHRRSLGGWLLAQQKMGKRTGKRVPVLKAEARVLMSKAKEAVPVWVMPLSRVVESFDPATQHFDVVILDEASQLDCMGYLALFLGKKVVVVGDDKQVSPEVVGVEVEEVQKLIDEKLAGVPLANLYDPFTSVYSMAKACFGGSLIQLTEHFRCAPEIIQFSNQFYNGVIRPLRDVSCNPIKPHVANLYVPSATETTKGNQAEAESVVSLLIELCADPRYEGKTMGVVVLLGNAGGGQTVLIENLLRQYLDPVEYERRRILVGTAPFFQGDERDVMVLSTVKAPKGGPLQLRNDDRLAKRINVAASRAKDQMWVVHSLNPDTDLKAGDLRRSLIEHAMCPEALMNPIRTGENKVESEFERRVFTALATHGYKVVPQWKVGAYRIDMVVQGFNPDGTFGPRLAVECDGDRFHPIEKIQEDLARQAILERMGWRFHRIRGTQFFRNPDRCIQELCEGLEAMGIRPAPPTPLDMEEVSAHQESLNRIRTMVHERRREWAKAAEVPSKPIEA